MPRLSRVVASLFAGALVLLAARMAWRLSRTEIGWETHRREWGRALAGFVGLSPPRLGNQEPEARARFWLGEVERALAKNDDPVLLAGAAWVLDSPELDFWARSAERRASAAASPGVQDPTRGSRVLAEHHHETSEYDARCAERCLELIERATQLDPKNSELWRSRALLLFRARGYPVDLTPRREDWQTILEECAAHDPGNALYEYLIAVRNWNDSAAIVPEQGRAVLEVRDQELFDRGDARLLEGIEKQSLKFGSDSRKMALAFLEQTSLSPLERVSTAESCSVRDRAGAVLLPGLYRWQRARQNVQRQRGQMEAVESTFRDLIHVARQMPQSGNTVDTVFESPILMEAGLSGLKGLTVSNPELFDAGEPEAISGQLAALKRQTGVLLEAVKRRDAQDLPAVNGREARRLAITAVALPLAAFLLCAVVTAYLIALTLGKRGDDASLRPGWAAHLASWCLGLIGTFVVFGLCPAGIIPGAVQTWSLRVFVFAACLIPSWLAIGLIHRWKRNRSLTIQAGVVLVLLGLAMSFGAAARVAPAEGVPWRALVADGPFDFSWRELAGRIGDNNAAWIFSGQDSDVPAGAYRRFWLPCLLQWRAYSGIELGAVLAMILLALWALCSRTRQAEGGLWQVARSEKRRYVRSSGTAIALSLGVAAILTLLVYLAAAPAATDALERSYQRRHARLADPGAGWRELETELKAGKR